MSIEDRTRWEQRHLRASSLSPRATVLELPRATRDGELAIDLACGQGRHAKALSDLGYDVIAMDVSIRALCHARSRAPSLHLLQADADAWPIAPGCLDLVVQVDFLERALFPVLRDSLRPGGRLFIDTFLDQGTPNADGPSNPSFLLKSGELLSSFEDFEIERYDETRGETARAALLARKRTG